LIEITTIRHGETEYNREGRMQGSEDSPLTEKGCLDAKITGKALSGRLKSISAWYVSPYGRARQTSRLIRAQFNSIKLPEETIDDRLREVNCGEFTGRLKKDLDLDIFAKIRSNPEFPYPGGECMIDLMNRGSDFFAFCLENILKSDKARAQSDSDSASLNEDHSVVIVSHGNISRAIGAVLTDLGPFFALRATLDNLGISKYASKNGKIPFSLKLWNDTGHLAS